MASGKVKKKSAKKSKGGAIVGIVIGIIIVCVAGYFIFMSGVLQRCMTGVKITETAADGSLNTVRNFSVQETNYHFNEVFSMYRMYGMISDQTLDNKVEESSEETWRQYLYKAAADDLQDIALKLRSMDADTTKPEFGADRYAELQIEEMKQQATNYKYTSFNQYLQAMYGTGFNTFDYKKIIKNEILAREYENYLKQFKFAPSDEDIQKAFDNDPHAYQSADFNYYFFAAEMDDAGNMKNLEETKAAAKEVVDAVNGGASFKDAVKTNLEKDKTKNESALVSFSDENVDPTVITGYSKESAENRFSEAVINAIYGADVAMGKAVVVDADNGTYAVLPNKLEADETPTVTYRTLTIDNPNYSNASTDDDSEEEGTKAPAADLSAVRAQAEQLVSGATMDPAAFADLVRKNSTDGNEIVSAGYVSGETNSATDSDPDEEEEGEEPSAADKELNTWLFDASRKQGDTLIVNADDGSKVTIYYFQSSVPAWKSTVSDSIVDTLIEGWQSEMKSGTPGYEISDGLCKFLLY